MALRVKFKPSLVHLRRATDVVLALLFATKLTPLATFFEGQFFRIGF